MPDQTIKCPKCGNVIPLTEALTDQIESTVRAKYEADAAEKVIEIEKERQALKQQAKEIEAKRQAIDEQIAEKLKSERIEIAEQEKTKIFVEYGEQITGLREELAEKSNKLLEANKKELEFLKRQRELEEKSEQIDLEVERKLSDERKKITEAVSKSVAEENMLKMREKDDQLDTMKKQIDVLKRKSELGSQEAQGEALEQEMQEYLERSFPYDTFQEVKKGARGADIVQIVHNTTGTECGKILWESKNTKDFQKTWTDKLKKDQQQANADIAVILSVVLPNEINNFDLYDGVWITNYMSFKGLATALRQQLIESTRQKAIAVGRDSMKDVVYNYITSQEFTMNIKAVVQAYKQMQDDLEAEKRSMTRIWKKREKQISAILDNVTGIYGSIEGIVGNQKALPDIQELSLDYITEDEGEFESDH